MITNSSSDVTRNNHSRSITNKRSYVLASTPMDRLLWYVIAGSRGGYNRARIIRALHHRPYNTNQLSELLKLDYKTIAHHLKVLCKNRIVISEGNGYGKMYFLNEVLQENYEIFEDIWTKIQVKEDEK